MVININDEYEKVIPREKYIELKKNISKYSEEYAECLDYIVKRELGWIIKKNISLPLSFAKILHSLISYKHKHRILTDQTSDILIVDFVNRQDHATKLELWEQLFTDSGNKCSKIGIFNEGEKLINASQRLKALSNTLKNMRSIAVFKKELELSLSEHLLVFNYFIRYEIDKIIALNTDTITSHKAIIAISLEGSRGFIYGSKLNNKTVKVFTAQHGIMGENYGFMEDRLSDYNFIWAEHYKDKILEQSYYEKYSETVVACSLFNNKTNPKTGKTGKKIIYLSSPAYYEKTNIDILIIKELIRLKETAEENSLTITIRTHPGIKKSYYDFVPSDLIQNGKLCTMDESIKEVSFALSLYSSALIGASMHFVKCFQIKYNNHQPPYILYGIQTVEFSNLTTLISNLRKMNSSITQEERDNIQSYYYGDPNRLSAYKDFVLTVINNQKTHRIEN